MSRSNAGAAKRRPKHAPEPPSQPDGPGIYLHWDGRRTYRTRMPAPRVLEPVSDLSFRSDENTVIEGDNLQVMVSLRSQYRGFVDIAYLDPPYNTGRNDFRYSDKRFRDPNAECDDAVYVSSEDGGRHTKWLNFMGPRLHLVWDLLADSGVCFVSIDDTELFRLGLLMDEIFGERNRVGILVWKGATENNAQRVATGHEYILCYAKRIESLPSVWTGSNEAKDWLLATYEKLKAGEPNVRKLDKAFKSAIRDHMAAYEKAVAQGATTDLVDLGTLDRYRHVDAHGPYAAERRTHKPNEGYFYDVIHPKTGKPCRKPSSGYRFTEEKFKQLLRDDRVIFGADHTQLWQLKVYLADIKPPLRGIVERDGRSGANVLKKLMPKMAEKFKHPKPVELIMQLLEFAGDNDALVLDPFAGSGTTGHAVLRLNARDDGRRRFIMIEEGSRDDGFCRTLTAPRIKAAIQKEKLPGGFMFQQCGRKLDRTAILELERSAIANVIIQTDATGTGRGITRVANAKYVIGANARGEAICLHWNGRNDSTVTGSILVEMFKEAKERGLARPLRVYGSTCEVGETDSFRFCQIPDEILAALHLVEDDSSGEHVAEADSRER